MLTFYYIQCKLVGKINAEGLLIISCAANYSKLWMEPIQIDFLEDFRRGIHFLTPDNSVKFDICLFLDSFQCSDGDDLAAMNWDNCSASSFRINNFRWEPV